MPRKTAAAAEPSVASSKAQYERELTTLAAQARADGSASPRGRQLRKIRAAVVVLSLAGFFAHAAQLHLSPVYGSLPAATYHTRLLGAAAFSGWAGNVWLAGVLRRCRLRGGRTGGVVDLPSFRLSAARLLPVLAVWAPLLLWLVEPAAGRLGPSWGPLLAETLAVFPVVACAAACAADSLEGLDLAALVRPLPVPLPGFVADGVPGMASWLLFMAFEDLARQCVARFSGGGGGGGGGTNDSNAAVAVGTPLVLSRVGMPLTLGGVMAVLAPPSAHLLLAAPALLHAAFVNPHTPGRWAAARAGARLRPHGWSLLDRAESTTGYVSVLENARDGFRVLRCDHSLLGGEYTDPKTRGGLVAEPIYAVFVMLEAVRLMETGKTVADGEAKALVIGLGIGTTPSALVAHGIDTTVVEIDPAVHAFAKRYFDLRENNPPILADADRYTRRLAADEHAARFDYIVHDVFTGGAEPVELFTLEFLQQLHTLLKPEGAIAINYAGDQTLPGPRAIVRTIAAVFPSCRIFREIPAAVDSSNSSGSTLEMDFANMVIFCKKSPGRLTFRAATERDMLGSFARREFLVPRHEVDIDEILAGDKGEGGGSDGDGDGVARIVRQNDSSIVTQSHKTSARGHWRIMRTVLPGIVWETW